MVQEAIEFLSRAQESQLNSGSAMVDISHPMDAADIVADIRPDEKLITAAILHDTVENYDVSYDEISEKFGHEVAELVAAGSDDLTLPWSERKRKKLREIEKASDDVKVVVLGDQLADLRLMARDYSDFGELFWATYSTERRSQLEWYFTSLRRVLFSLSYTHYYQEFSVLVTGLFESSPRQALVS